MPRDQSYYGQHRWLPFRNDSGETVPAFACVRVNGSLSDGTLLVIKPTSAFPQLHGANGYVAVPDGGRGEMTFDLPAWILWEQPRVSPAVGESWEPRPGEWKIRKGGHRFKILTIQQLLTAAGNKAALVGPC